MSVQKISLSDFRNFRRLALSFSEKTSVIIGANASGKTNILESLFLLSTGKSFKAHLEEEMINYDKDIARIKATVGEMTLEVLLTRGLIDIGASRPEKVPRKRLLVGGVPKRLLDFTGNFKSVLFGPWDLDLITEAPSLRRRFLDNAISQVDREYRRGLLSYEKGLRQRNRLLFRIREEGLSRSQLLFWNQLLIKNGDYVSDLRANFIDFINSTAALGGQAFSVDYDKSAISEARLDQYQEEEIAAATTLVGPHRDDFIIKILSNGSKVIKDRKQRDLSRFGSRGEQRMGVLWLKLAEIAFIEKETGTRPTLLLDDIFSELDHEHREIVMQAAGRQQTIITTADSHFIEKFKKVEKINLGG
ncbi:DNA replication and repair protein RecF [Candidatus Woesebacteria bacterium]|nr:DNA replication and repair protein RecF [Candidatus Woesebacteria bacterium]